MTFSSSLTFPGQLWVRSLASAPSDKERAGRCNCAADFSRRCRASGRDVFEALPERRNAHAKAVYALPRPAVSAGPRRGRARLPVPLPLDNRGRGGALGPHPHANERTNEPLQGGLLGRAARGRVEDHRGGDDGGRLTAETRVRG
jgi:hypothetical protein